MILLKPVWEISSFLFASLWLCSSHHVLGVRYCYDLKDATNCGQCAGTRQCGQEKVSLSPDPKPSISLLLRLTGLLLASPWEGQGGGWEQGGKFAHTFQAAFGAFHSPHSHTGDCECAARAGSVFFQPVGRCQCDSLYELFDGRLSSVSWIPPGPLVELYHWLQGEGTKGLVTSRWLWESSPNLRRPAALTQVLSSYCWCAICTI